MGYLEKRAIHPPLISTPPPANLSMVIVIPMKNEKDPLLVLNALLACHAPKNPVEIIVVVNDSENDAPIVKTQNQATIALMQEWSSNLKKSKLSFHFFYDKNIPAKIAGVGYARKIGMDEALRRLPANGVIVCLDADTKVAENYLKEIALFFEQHPKSPACSIAYEHPLEGSDFDADTYAAIIDYELHLRYFLAAKKFTGFPFAFETIGSAMAVRASAYEKQGGMNKRKAGEDFYFLHKFTSHPSFRNLTTTKVFPSPRVSDRVPFGTGKAVGDLLESKTALKTYNLRSFVDLKSFFDQVPNLYMASEGDFEKLLKQQPEGIATFLIQNKWKEEINRIQKNTSSIEAFIHQFFRWFDNFMIMKYCHHCRAFNGYEDIQVGLPAFELLKKSHPALSPGLSNKALLMEYRRIALTE